MLSEGPFETTEGHDPVMVDIIATLPPQFMCANRNDSDGPEVCQVMVEVVIAPDANDQSCISGQSYPQAVVGYPVKDDGMINILTFSERPYFICTSIHQCLLL